MCDPRYRGQRDLCAGRRSSRCDHGRGKRWYRDDRLHHRAHSRARHDEGSRVRNHAGFIGHRPQLPRSALAWRSQDGNHACGIVLTRKCWCYIPERTLTYEVVDELTRAGIGQSTVVGIGGDPVIGQTFVDVLKEFENDPQTKAVVLIGEVGGNLEEEGAKCTDLPIVAYIAGISAPPDKRMGHAGAIVEGGEGDARSKIARLKKNGVPVASRPSEIPDMVRKLFCGC